MTRRPHVRRRPVLERRLVALRRQIEAGQAAGRDTRALEWVWLDVSAQYAALIERQQGGNRP